MSASSAPSASALAPSSRAVGSSATSHLRPDGERSRHRGSLALARGELADGPLGVLGQADGGESLAPTAASTGTTAQRQRQLGVLARAEERDEPERLTDERDRPATQLCSSGAVEPGERDAVDEHVTLVRQLEPREQVQQRRLAGARRPGHDGELPGRERRVEPLERRRRPVPLRQPARLDRLCSCNTSSLRTAWLSGRRGGACVTGTLSPSAAGSTISDSSRRRAVAWRSIPAERRSSSGSRSQPPRPTTIAPVAGRRRRARR